jgi:hypothetical protein
MMLFAATAVCMAAAAPSAQAGVLVKSATNCDAQSVEQPFSRWLDPSSYVLVPNGDVESGNDSWTLGGGYAASGNEPWYVHGAGETSSMKIPAGRSVTTGSICVGLEHPTMRFFARSSGGLLSSVTSVLAVEVQFEDSLGGIVSLPIGVVPTSLGSWTPTLPYPVVANLLPLLPGDHTAVRFRFTAVGGASWQIDDVYVDPRSRV